jgi:hypothetical protein
MNALMAAAHEFDGLISVAEDVAGRKAAEIITLDELFENLFKDTNQLKG